MRRGARSFHQTAIQPAAFHIDTIDLLRQGISRYNCGYWRRLGRRRSYCAGEVVMRVRPVAAALLVLVIAPTSTPAQDYPARRAGHWELTLTLEGGGAPPEVIQQCVDAET